MNLSAGVIEKSIECLHKLLFLLASRIFHTHSNAQKIAFLPACCAAGQRHAFVYFTLAPTNQAEANRREEVYVRCSDWL